MSFNPDKNKQTQEVVFSGKQSKPKHPQLLFNKTPVAHSSSQKHFGIILDEQLSFTNHIKVKIQKASIGINVIKVLLLDPTLTMVMSFMNNLIMKVCAKQLNVFNIQKLL